MAQITFIDPTVKTPATTALAARVAEIVNGLPEGTIPAATPLSPSQVIGAAAPPAPVSLAVPGAGAATLAPTWYQKPLYTGAPVTVAETGLLAAAAAAIAKIAGWL